MIAEAAGVDPGLVARSFGDKDGLFRAPAVAAGPKRTAGTRMAKLVVDTWEDPDQRAPLLALLTSTGVSSAARTLLRDVVTLRVQVPFVAARGFDEPERRGALLGAHFLGLATARYILALEALASLAPDALVEIVGRSSQQLLTMRLPD
jgi:Tetracyclin repressor-like, C-terminal domain